MPKKVLIALPPAMLNEVDYIAACEHRTRSDMIREALRRYLGDFKKSNGGTIPALPAGVVAKTHEVDEPLSAAQIGGPASRSSMSIQKIEPAQPIEPVVEETKEPVQRTAIIGFQNKTIVPAQPPDTGFVWTRNPR